MTFKCNFALVLVMLFLFAGMVSADAAVVVFCDGEITMTPPGGGTPVLCSEGITLEQGARLVTAADASFEISFDADRTQLVRIKGGSDVIVLMNEDGRIELVSGELVASVKNIAGGEAFRIKTPSASCGIRGTEWEVSVDGKDTTISVLSGEVFVAGIDRRGDIMKKEYRIKAGYARKVERFKKPQRMRKIGEELSRDMRKDLDILNSPENAGKKARMVRELREEKMRQALSQAETRGAFNERRFEDMRMAGEAHPALRGPAVGAIDLVEPPAGSAVLPDPPDDD